MDVRFTAPIGVDVKGETWSCVEVPGSADLFGTGGALKATAGGDGAPLTAGLLPTGRGGHMLSISAKLRRTIGKDVGDDVVVHITERLT
ncbi:hypothetical protein AC792_08060 [Arthrobacter sp. RIT-PI-e]|uniref:DUF1905 domain-containing protein n=1 Tax=Arthrobacter sp. RIT-PI-e TaxID=1681197 RepID=UPI000675E01B|nr:DUF1905 domain-containing protein [Arthrobacter sp. RIT-PI-e]KNC19070.1 hypothetical protein AC792_08060 [Arthrobacter sp. RIT-PI-e]